MATGQTTPIDVYGNEGGGVGVPTQRVWVYRGAKPGSGTLVYEEFPPGSDTASTTVRGAITVAE